MALRPVVGHDADMGRPSLTGSRLGWTERFRRSLFALPIGCAVLVSACGSPASQALQDDYTTNAVPALQLAVGVLEELGLEVPEGYPPDAEDIRGGLNYRNIFSVDSGGVGLEPAAGDYRTVLDQVEEVWADAGYGPHDAGGLCDTIGCDDLSQKTFGSNDDGISIDAGEWYISVEVWREENRRWVRLEAWAIDDE